LTHSALGAVVGKEIAMLPYPPRELSGPRKSTACRILAYPDTFNACYELLDANLAAGRGSAPAIYWADSVVTYRQLTDEVMKIAGALRERGVKRAIASCSVTEPAALHRGVSRRFSDSALSLCRRRRSFGSVRSARLSRVPIPVVLIFEKDLWAEVERLDSNAVRA
jgi:hypothetical protein